MCGMQPSSLRSDRLAGIVDMAVTVRRHTLACAARHLLTHCCRARWRRQWRAPARWRCQARDTTLERVPRDARALQPRTQGRAGAVRFGGSACHTCAVSRQSTHRDASATSRTPWCGAVLGRRRAHRAALRRGREAGMLQHLAAPHTGRFHARLTGRRRNRSARQVQQRLARSQCLMQDMLLQGRECVYRCRLRQRMRESTHRRA